MLYAEKMAGLGGTWQREHQRQGGEVYAKGYDAAGERPGQPDHQPERRGHRHGCCAEDVLQNDRNIRAYVDTETARIFFGDSAQDIFGTVLHEDYHWYNALDTEGARTLQEHALEYLAKSSGYESLDEMIRAKLQDYSAQSLTYEQAAEELVADAWRGIFDSEERLQALGDVPARAGREECRQERHHPQGDGAGAADAGWAHQPGEGSADHRPGQPRRPESEAAGRGRKRALQDEYFAHAEKAMDNLRAAKENAATLKTESAAEKQGFGFRF